MRARLDAACFRTAPNFFANKKKESRKEEREESAKRVSAVSFYGDSYQFLPLPSSVDQNALTTELCLEFKTSKADGLLVQLLGIGSFCTLSILNGRIKVSNKRIPDVTEHSNIHSTTQLSRVPNNNTIHRTIEMQNARHIVIFRRNTSWKKRKQSLSCRTIRTQLSTISNGIKS